ncbi:hypothetical protein ACMFMG_004327 [Clarireedia jacksonii]
MSLQSLATPKEDELQAFHRYSDLPKELQLRILSFVYQTPRVIPIWMVDGCDPENDSHLWAMYADLWLQTSGLVNVTSYAGFDSWFCRKAMLDMRIMMQIGNARRLGIDDMSTKLPSEYWTLGRPRYLPNWISPGKQIREIIPRFENWMRWHHEIVFYTLPKGHALCARTNLVEVEKQLNLSEEQRLVHDQTVLQVTTMYNLLHEMQANGCINSVEGRQRARVMYPGCRWVPLDVGSKPQVYRFMAADTLMTVEKK